MRCFCIRLTLPQRQNPLRFYTNHPIPTSCREAVIQTELLKCPAYLASFIISNWKVADTGEVMIETPTRPYTISDLLAKDDLCNVYRCTFNADGKNWQQSFRIDYFDLLAARYALAV